jgi:predicted Zn-dependent protease
MPPDMTPPPKMNREQKRKFKRWLGTEEGKLAVAKVKARNEAARQQLALRKAREAEAEGQVQTVVSPEAYAKLAAQ